MTDKMVIEVDLQSIVGRYAHGEEAGSQTLADALVQQAAIQLLNALGRDDAISSVRKRAAEIRDEQIEAALQPLIQQAVEAAIQPTDHYGNPKGEAKTLAEVITEEAKQALTVPRSDGYGRERHTLVTKLIKDEVERAVTRELRQALDEAKTKVKAAVQAEGAKVIADTIARMNGIRSVTP